MTLPKVLYREPTIDERIAAGEHGKQYSPVFNNSTLNHWKLLDIPKDKKCNCTKRL